MQRIHKKKAHWFIKIAIYIVLGVGFVVAGQAGIAHAKEKGVVQNAPAASGNIKIYLRAAPIIVTFEDSRWVANRIDIRNWISVTCGTASVDASNFVNAIASQVNIAPTESADGRSVDTDALTGDIKETINRGLPGQTITLKTQLVPRGGDHRIDINLSEQTLYAFEGSRLANQFLVSTGRRGYATPTGEFHIYGKDRSARMHGPGYYLPNVPYISWFSGDYSIHGTYWHHNFGHVMSHGCVNMETGAAEWIFGWADIGTPVYIHY